MANGFSFMQNYVQVAPSFIHGENFDKQQSMIFLQFVVCRLCEFSCWYISIVYTLLVKFEFLARAPNESRLKFFTNLL